VSNGLETSKTRFYWTILDRQLL